MGPVFLFDMSVVVFFVGPPSGELDFSVITEGFEVVVDETSNPLSESMPKSLKGRLCSMSSIAVFTPYWPLPMTARVSTQVE